MKFRRLLTFPWALGLSAVAHASPCEFNLVSVDEAVASIHFDLLALDHLTPRTVHDFPTIADEKVPTVRALGPLHDLSTVGPRRTEIVRGYARFLARRRKHLGLFHNQGFLWTKPAAGVIYDLASGEAVETLGVSVSLGASRGRRQDSSRERGRRLLQDLVPRLIGSDRDDDGPTAKAAPDWALISTEDLAEAVFVSSLLRSNTLVAADARIDIGALRSSADYEASLERKIDFKRLVNRAETSGTHRGRLIYDMETRGYGLEWIESWELLDIIEVLKPMTHGHYVLTLFWDSRNLIEITDGVVRTYRE